MSDRNQRVSGVMGLALVALAGGALFGCPDEEDVESFGGGNLEIPDRLQSSGATVLLRIGEADSTTSSRVHDALGAMFDEQGVRARDAVLRGPYDEEAALREDAAGLGGHAAEQTAAVLQRVLVEKRGLFSESEAVDACGNPMLASFVTGQVLRDVLPEGGGVSLSDITSPGACVGDCDTTADGVWDVTLTERRRDGMLDMLIQVFPSVTESPERPGLMGHLSAFFLTDNNPGFWQIPLWVSAEKALVSVSALLQQSHVYIEPHYNDIRSVFVYPHRARTVSAKDISVSMLGDPLCDEHFASVSQGSLPYGCKLADGRDLPVQLDVDSPLGKSVYQQVTDYGRSSKAIEDMQRVLAYQVSAFLACPTFDTPLFVSVDHVDVMVCPSQSPLECVGYHDMEDAGCDYEQTDLFPATALTVPANRTPVAVELSDNPYLLTKDQGVGPSSGVVDGMTLEFDATEGDVVTIYTDSFGRIDLRSPRDGRMTAEQRENSHCDGSAYEWSIAASGRHTIEISGNADLRLLLTSPAKFQR